MVHTTFKASVIAATALFPLPAWSVLLAGDAAEGAPIHQANCIGCHQANFGGDGTTVYTRENRNVNSIEGLMGQVARCNEMTGAGLSADQVDDLVAYLNEEYYRFEE